MKKTVLIASAVFPPEPVTSASMNYDLAKELAKSYNVIVLRAYPTRPQGVHYDSDELNESSFKVVTLSSYTCPESKLIGRFRESISYSREVVKYLTKNNLKVDFIYNDAWHLLGYNIIARYAVRHDIPYIVPVQDIYPESLYTRSSYPSFVKKCIDLLFKPIDRYTLIHAAKVRTITDEMVDYLSETRNVPRSHFSVINNWQDDEAFLCPLQKNCHDKFTISYVGSINDHANVQLIIKAFHQAGIANSQLNIYGGGNRKNDCIGLVKELEMNNVSFKFVDKTQIPNVQGESDVLVLSLSKGNAKFCLPSKLTSYMMSGKPIVASVDSDSSTAKILSLSGGGIVAEAGIASDLADAMVLLSKMSNQQREEIGKNARKYANSHLTKSINLHKIVNDINSILKK